VENWKNGKDGKPMPEECPLEENSTLKVSFFLLRVKTLICASIAEILNLFAKSGRTHMLWLPIESKQWSTTRQPA